MARTNLGHWTHCDVPPHGCQRAGARDQCGRTRRAGRMRRARARTLRLTAVQSPPRRRPTAVAAEPIGTPCSPHCWSRGRRARRRGAAGRCAPWGSARLALGRTRRWAAAAQITPLSITVRAVPCLPPPYRCTWRRPAAPAPPFYRLPPSPTLPTSAISLPSCLSRPSRRAPCHWPASLDRSTRNSSHTTLPSPPKRRPSLADSVGVLPRAVREGGYSSARGKCGRAPLGAGTGTREISR